MQFYTTINGKRYLYSNEVKNTEIIRKSFDGLSQKIFGLSFENWYINGYWEDKYIPHVLIYNGNVAANVSVNIIDTEFNGQSKRYIQLGTIMTEEAYRNQGLSRFLIGTVLNDWQNKCDAVFLFANDSVLNFYPRFNFSRAEEYQYSVSLTGNISKGKLRRLDMDNKNDVNILLEMYHKGNHFSKLPMILNDGLIMFYCSQFMKENVFYCDELNAVIIAEYCAETIICYDIFGGYEENINNIIPYIALPDTRRIIFGFTPKDTNRMEVSLLKEDDTTLFLLNTKERLFDNCKLMFPLLSHA